MASCTAPTSRCRGCAGLASRGAPRLWPGMHSDVAGKQGGVAGGRSRRGRRGARGAVPAPSPAQAPTPTPFTSAPTCSTPRLLKASAYVGAAITAVCNSWSASCSAQGSAPGGQTCCRQLGRRAGTVDACSWSTVRQPGQHAASSRRVSPLCFRRHALPCVRAVCHRAAHLRPPLLRVHHRQVVEPLRLHAA